MYRPATSDRTRRSRPAAWLKRTWRRIEAPPTPSPLTRHDRRWLLAGFAFLVMMRLPLAWVHGRFQDEEGTIFLAYAWHRPAADALFRSFAGYLNIGANAATLAVARLVRVGALPLEAAPHLTMLMALLVQLVPALLLLTARPPWLSDRRALVASLLIIAASPLTEEVFLNTLHIQLHLALAAGLILALDVPTSTRARIGHALPLLIGPLCGPGAIILLPLFALRALVDRSLARLAQAAVLGAGAVIQLSLFYSSSPIRGAWLDPATLAAVLGVRLAALPLLTPPLARAIDDAVYESYQDGTIFWWFAALAAVTYFGMLLRAALRDRRDPAIWLFGAGLSVGAVSFGHGMIISNQQQWFSVGAAERYDFIPLALIGIGLVALAARVDDRHHRRWVVLCVMTLVSGLVGYVVPIGELRNGPAWPIEVAAWRHDHDHPLATWPMMWTVDLSDRDRPCTRPPVVRAAPAEPSYCEGAWLARVLGAVEQARPAPAER